MAKITKQSENFSKWYTDVILEADLADYGPVKGTMVIKPYGYSLWQNVKNTLNNMIEESGHENAYFPLFILSVSYTHLRAHETRQHLL